MSVDELAAYFQNIELPNELRLDRACTQYNVSENVNGLLANMRAHPEKWRHEHQLLRIKNALENPYDGPEIPKF